VESRITMQTVIEMPDSLYKKVKASAAHKGVLVDDFVQTALASATKDTSADSLDNQQDEQLKRAESFYQSLDGRSQSSPVGHLDRDQLYDRKCLL